jgi:hypothetical protein
MLIGHMRLSKMRLQPIQPLQALEPRARVSLSFDPRVEGSSRVDATGESRAFGRRNAPIDARRC